MVRYQTLMRATTQETLSVSDYVCISMTTRLFSVNWALNYSNDHCEMVSRWGYKKKDENVVSLSFGKTGY